MSTISSRPSIAELRAACQPPEVMARYSAEHWAGRLYMRRLSIYVTWLLVRARVPANAITVVMALVGLGGAVAFAGPGLGWAIAGAVLVQVYLLLDCSDGEVARWTRTTSAAGIYLDRLGHYVVEAALLVALGWRASFAGWSLSRSRYLLVGLAAAIVHLLGKVETDLVHVARARHGLLPVPDTAEAAAPRARGLARLRRVAALLPLNRLTGAVEASWLILGAAVADRLTDRAVTRGLMLGLAAITVYVAVGHLLMILASRRLR